MNTLEQLAQKAGLKKKEDSINQPVQKGTVNNLDALAQKAGVSVVNNKVVTENTSTLKKVADFFTGNTQKFGKTLGTAISQVDPYTNKIREETLSRQQSQSDEYIRMAKEAPDKEKSKMFLNAAKKLADTEGVDIFNNPEYQKTAKQVYGEGLGTALETLSLGSFSGKASKMPTVIKPLLPLQNVARGVKEGAKTGAIYGGVFGAGNKISGSMQENKSVKDIVKEGAIGGVEGALTGGVLGGAIGGISTGISEGTKVGAKKINKYVSGNIDDVIAKREKDIFDIENNYQSTRKSMDYSKDANSASRRRVAETDVLVGSADNSGIIRTKGKGGAVDKYKEQKINGVEGLVREKLKEEGISISPNIIARKLREKILNSGLEGKPLNVALGNIDAELEGLMLRADSSGRIPLSVIQDAKISTTGGINYQTPPHIKREAKSFASAYKEIIEQESKIGIDKINKELQKYYQDIKLIESLDGKRVKGGKLGKYFAQISGNVVGGAVGGAVGGIPGAAVGTVAGGEISSKLKGGLMSKYFGKSIGKEISKNKVLEEAKQKGAKLLLPKPSGQPLSAKEVNLKPILLPKQSSSTLQAREAKNIAKQVAEKANAELRAKYTNFKPEKMTTEQSVKLLEAYKGHIIDVKPESQFSDSFETFLKKLKSTDDKNNLLSVSGGAYGIEAQRDEKGNIIGFKFNPEKAIVGMGLSMAVVKSKKPNIVNKIAKKIDNIDKEIMINFIDNTRLRKPENIYLEINARKIAEAMGLNPDVRNSVLANKFDEILTVNRSINKK